MLKIIWWINLMFIVLSYLNCFVCVKLDFSGMHILKINYSSYRPDVVDIVRASSGDGNGEINFPIPESEAATEASYEAGINFCSTNRV